MWKSSPCLCGFSIVRFMGLGWAASWLKALWHTWAYPHLFPQLPEFRQLLFMQHVGWDLSTVEANKALNPGESMYPPHPSTGKHVFLTIEKKPVQLLVSSHMVWSDRPLCIKEGPRRRGPPCSHLRKFPDTWEYPDGREVPIQPEERGLSSHWKWLGCEPGSSVFPNQMFWRVFSGLTSRGALLSSRTLSSTSSTWLDLGYLGAQWPELWLNLCGQL